METESDQGVAAIAAGRLEAWPLLRGARRLRLTQELGVALSILVLFGIFAYIQPLFAKPSNMVNILTQTAEPALLAMGQAFTMIAGGFDLSMEGTVGLVSVVVATSVLSLGLVPGLILGLLLGIGIGGVNGTLIARFRVPPFIVTLGMASLAQGIAYLVSGGLPVFNLPDSFGYLGTRDWGPLPVAVVIAGVTFVILYVIVSRSRVGYQIYAIGGNESAARLAGVRVVRIRILVYVISGLLAALAAVLLSSRVQSGQPSIGIGTALISIAAVIIGGVRLGGGEGSLVGVVLGVLLLGELANGLDLINMPSYVQLVATGGIVMAASFGSVARARREED